MRDSSRLAVDHIPVKLHAVGCDIEPMTGWEAARRLPPTASFPAGRVVGWPLPIEVVRNLPVVTGMTTPTGRAARMAHTLFSEVEAGDGPIEGRRRTRMGQGPMAGAERASQSGPVADPAGVRRRIEVQFEQQTQREVQEISIQVVDGVAILTGIVHSGVGQRIAVDAARAVPGVRDVYDGLRVDPSVAPNVPQPPSGSRKQRGVGDDAGSARQPAHVATRPGLPTTPPGVLTAVEVAARIAGKPGYRTTVMTARFPGLVQHAQRMAAAVGVHVEVLHITPRTIQVRFSPSGPR